MDVKGLKKMIGLPDIPDGRAGVNVIRSVPEQDGRALRGVVIRSGPTGARWLPREQIELPEQLSLIARGEPEKAPKDAAYRLFRVTDPDGERIGIVTEAPLNEKTLRVMALVISSSPIDGLINRRRYATPFHVLPAGETGHVTLARAREEAEKTQENS